MKKKRSDASNAEGHFYFFVYNIEGTTPTVIEGTIKDGTVALIGQIALTMGGPLNLENACMYTWIVNLNSNLMLRMQTIS